MILRKTDRLLKKLNKEEGRQNKLLVFVLVVISICLMAFAIYSLFQADKIDARDETIKTMKTDMEAMATQAAADQKEIAKHKNKIKDIRGKWLDSIAKAEDLKYWNSEYKKCASGLIEACKLIMNWCTDIDIPKLRACLERFGEIIKDTKKYHISEEVK